MDTEKIKYQKAKDTVAKKHGYKDWDDLVNLIGRNGYLYKYEKEATDYYRTEMYGGEVVDWKKLREEFFKDNTRTREMGVTGDFAMTDFNTLPHNVFEWFKNKLSSLSIQPKESGREVEFAEFISKKKYTLSSPPKYGNGDYMWFMTKDSIGVTTSELFQLFLKQNPK